MFVVFYSSEMAGRSPGTTNCSVLVDYTVPLRNFIDSLHVLLNQLRDGESRESKEQFDLQHFWEMLEQCFKVASQEATKFSLAFSKPPLPSAEGCGKLVEDIEKSVVTMSAVYYWLPKCQGTTLRRIVREATIEVVDGVVQLIETIVNTPLQSLSQAQLMSTGGVWEACDQITHLPRDNQAAVLSVMSSHSRLVKDALEEMEQAQNSDGDPFSDVLDDADMEERGNRDTYWSEADRQLMAPCCGLMKASKACLKKIAEAVKNHGKVGEQEYIAQLDDLADCSNEISPSIDELVLCLYPPMNYIAVRLNAAKLASVLKKMLDIAGMSHVCPESENSWVQFLSRAVDHNMDKVKELTPSSA